MRADVKVFSLFLCSSSLKGIAQGLEWDLEICPVNLRMKKVVFSHLELEVEMFSNTFILLLLPFSLDCLQNHRRYLTHGD